MLSFRTEGSPLGVMRGACACPRWATVDSATTITTREASRAGMRMRQVSIRRMKRNLIPRSRQSIQFLAIDDGSHSAAYLPPADQPMLSPSYPGTYDSLPTADGSQTDRDRPLPGSAFALHSVT